MGVPSIEDETGAKRKLVGITPVEGGVTASLTQIRRHWANLYPEAQETPLDEDAEAESTDEAEDN